MAAAPLIRERALFNCWPKSIGLGSGLLTPLQSSCEKLVGRLDRLVKPDLFSQKRMRRVFDDGEPRRNTQFLHLTAKSIGMRTGIVRLAGDEPAGRILPVEVMQRRSEPIRRQPVFLRAAKELSPDPPALFVHRNLAGSLRKEIALSAHGNGRLNRAAEIGVSTVTFKLFCSGRRREQCREMTTRRQPDRTHVLWIDAELARVRAEESDGRLAVVNCRRKGRFTAQAI